MEEVMYGFMLTCRDNVLLGPLFLASSTREVAEVCARVNIWVNIWVNMKAAASTQLGVMQTSGALLLNFLLDTLFDYCLTVVDAVKPTATASATTAAGARPRATLTPGKYKINIMLDQTAALL